MKKAKQRYSKEKTAEYYSKKKESIKEKPRERYKNLSQKGKDKINEHQRKKYQDWFSIKKKRLKINELFLCFCSI